MLADKLADPAAILSKSQHDLMRKASPRWLSMAEALKPELESSPFSPVSVVEVQRDVSAWQACRMKTIGPANEVLGKTLRTGDSFILDFGEHRTGRLTFSLAEPGEAVDTPIRLALLFAEVPAELEKPFDPYAGSLCRAWLQDEILTIDHPIGEHRLARRCAFRYVKITVLAVRDGRLAFSRLGMEARTSARSVDVPALPETAPKAWVDIDCVARRTLRECMQTVFEDGPKRDRRLWLGDLRLEALANEVTFKNFALVKRCLLLFAACPLEDGLVSACAYDEPSVRGGNTRIPDYAALFASTLLEYVHASGDLELAKELWPVALRQVSVLLSLVNDEGLFQVPEKGWWLFIDWNAALDRQAALQGAIILCLRRTVDLARLIGVGEGDTAVLETAALRMTLAARGKLWDGERQFFVSGPTRQVSVLSQSWMVLAGVSSGAEALGLLTRVLRESDAVMPVSPYGWHYLVEACFACGTEGGRMGMEIMERYWGGMLARGADTFWEVFDAANPFLSPYRDHRVNSYCHAWSCTPSWFIRRALLPKE